MTYKILVPVDSIDEYTRELANTVNNLCRHSDSRLQLLHVLSDLEDVDAREVDENLLHGDELLSEFAGLLNCPSDHVEKHIQIGSPESEIIKRAIISRTDVIAMPTRDKSGIDKLLLGSVAEHVIRHARCPVVVTHRQTEPEAKANTEVSRILVPLDGSQESASIVPAVVDFARTHRSKVVLFHDEVGLNEDEFNSPSSSAIDYIEKIRNNIEQQGIDVSFETSCHVDPVKEIVNKVDELEADMVAMATHGRTGLSRLMFGSVVEGFLRRCDCPLLTVSVAPTHTMEYEEKYLG